MFPFGLPCQQQLDTLAHTFAWSKRRHLDAIANTQLLGTNDNKNVQEDALLHIQYQHNRTSECEHGNTQDDKTALDKDPKARKTNDAEDCKNTLLDAKINHAESMRCR